MSRPSSPTRCATWYGTSHVVFVCVFTCLKSICPCNMLPRAFVWTANSILYFPQWFGDTVGFAFWNELWLAEGPATYFENVGGEAAAGGSAFLDRFYADSVTRFLEHDAAAGATHPLAADLGAAPIAALETQQLSSSVSWHGLGV